MATMRWQKSQHYQVLRMRLARLLKRMVAPLRRPRRLKMMETIFPHDEQLRGGKLAPVSLPKFEDPISAETAEPKEVENPFGNIAPKNPNWDLKRDVQKRIDKLERRTQKALAEIALEQQREKEALEESQD
ncbi:unnamed protein product [Miscanthus lutarioriparius]|uniref:Coiled-coil domain-containing protein 12 n=1 Tax=Miscanthus lutarioriparius TaxID=422564 RepID=A0A811SSD5_9POAL|nr:unnamed protein product [Miscanthus lutarioriparius]